MSWLSENYEKAALGVAIVAVAAVGYFILSEDEEVPEVLTVSPKEEVEISARKNLVAAVEKYNGEYVFGSKVDNGNEVSSFIAYPLYSIKGQTELTPLSNSYEIHEGMPIEWWKKYKLEDYTQEDGPDLDPDKDGFTNREEKDAGTNPTLENEHPHYLTKLKCEKVNASNYEIRWSKVNAEKANFSFTYNGVRQTYFSFGVNNEFPDKKVKKKTFINRFKILEKAKDPKIPGESGEYYVIQDNLKEEDQTFKLYYNKKKKFDDWKATMIIDIPVNSINKPFPLAEGDSFSLPYDPEAKMKDFKFISKKEGKLFIQHNVKGVKSPLMLDVPTK